MAAFIAPLMATVATGIPGGICKMLYKASTPSSTLPLIGTPITGKDVLAAITPGNAAAIPAPAIITLMPRAFAPLAKCSTASGVRWAERAFTSKGTCMSLRNCMAFSMTGRSLVLPMMILTNGDILFDYNEKLMIYSYSDTNIIEQRPIVFKNITQRYRQGRCPAENQTPLVGVCVAAESYDWCPTTLL